MGFDGGPWRGTVNMWALFLYLLATEALKEELFPGSQDQVRGSGSQVLLSH